jgi:glycosyltransferase involved in cell wall biosynthesis
MRVLHFISCPAAGGAETLVKDISIEMVRNGHSVLIVFLNSAKEIGHDQTYEAKYLKELKANGIEWSFVSSGARKNPFRGMLVLAGIVKKYSPEIIHCHLYYALLFSFFITRIPVVYTHHSMSLELPKWVFRLITLNVSAFVGISLLGSRLLGDSTSKLVKRIDNALSLSRVSVPKSKSFDMIKVVMVGCFRPEKDYPFFMESLRHLDDLAFRVEIAGEGGDREKIEQLISSFGLAEKVSLLGNVPNIPKLLSTADIFAMSSSSEGLPIALLEATAAGLPVIVTNVGACSEVVHACQNGVIIDGSSPADYAYGLRSLIESPRAMNFYSASGSLHAKRYCVERSAESHSELYDAICSR